MIRPAHAFSCVALLAAFCVLVPVYGTGQTIVHSFDGDKGVEFSECQPATTRCGRQPESNVAADGHVVVQVTWQNLRVYDYNGKLLRSTPFSEFVKNAGLNPEPPKGKGPFEPHVVYDEFLRRWIVTVTCANDCLLVSATSDPMAAWGGVYLSCSQGGPCLNFDPAIHIGYDRNGLYYCGGHAGDEHPKTVPGYAYDCFAVPSAEVKPIAHGIAPTHLNRRHNMPLDILPVIDHDPHKPAGAPVFFAAKTCSRAEPGGCQRSNNFPFEWIVDTFTWNGRDGVYNAGGEQIVKTDAGSTRNKWLYNLPCCGATAVMPQAGSDIGLRAAESHRLINLVQFGSHIYGVLGTGPCTHDCGEQGVDTNNVMIWVDLDCSKSTACVVGQTGKIAGESVNPVFGTIGVDARGNLGIVAMSSTAVADLSILLWTRRTADPPGAFQGPTTIATGTQPYSCLNNNKLALIGNAAGILTLRDPRDGNKLWTSQQWSNDGTRCVWNTRIVEYQVDSTAKGAAKQSRRAE
jgi:hypothetical protein